MLNDDDRISGPYAGDGVQTSFPLDFKVFSASDIAVTTVTSGGLSTVLVLNTDYGVILNADQDLSPGGIVTYPLVGSPLPVGSTLTITSNLPKSQPFDFQTAGAFNASRVEDSIDRIVMLLQQSRDVSSRAITYPASDGLASMEVPNKTLRANKLFSWDANGNPSASIPSPDSAAALATALADTAGAGNGASLIGWLRALTGAVATTVKSWISWQDVSLFEFLTIAQIADYQAGTRTLDLTVPMQAWVTACAGRRGILPKGAAKITAALTLPTSIEIIGQGWGSSIHGYNCGIFVMPAGRSFVELRQMILFSRDGAGVADPRTQKAISFEGQFASRVNFVTLEDLYLQGWNVGINLEYTWYSKIDNVYTINTSTSLRLLGQSVNTSVVNSYLIANAGNRSVELSVDAGHRGEGLTITNSLLASGGNAVYSNGFLDLSIVGCTCDLLTGIAFDLTGVDNFVFDSPWVYSANRAFDINDVGSPVDTGTSIKVGLATVTGNDDVIYIGSGNKGVHVHDSSLYKVAGVGYPIEVQGVEANISGVHITNGGSSASDVYVAAADVHVSGITGDNLVEWNTSPVQTVASVAGAMTLPPSHSDTYIISGNLAITSIPVLGFTGKRVTLVSTGGTWTLTDGSNLKLNGNFVATADDSITIACVGANWYEVSRSVN